MTVTVNATSTSDTFDFWRKRTNELANAMSTQAVTVNSNTAVGDAAITGNFTANNIFLNSLNLANGTSNIAVTIPTTTQVSNNQFYLNANGSWSTVSSGFVGAVSISSLTTTIVDSFEFTTYGAAEYIVSAKDNNANNQYATKIMMTHNSGSVYMTEYGVLLTNTSIGSFASTSNSTHAILNFTSTTSNATIKFIRTAI